MASKRITKELKDLQKDPPTSCSAGNWILWNLILEEDLMIKLLDSMKESINEFMGSSPVVNHGNTSVVNQGSASSFRDEVKGDMSVSARSGEGEDNDDNIADIAADDDQADSFPDSQPLEKATMAYYMMS